MNVCDEDITLSYREREYWEQTEGYRPSTTIDPWDDRMEKWNRSDDVLNYRHERIDK